MAGGRGRYRRGGRAVACLQEKSPSAPHGRRPRRRNGQEMYAGHRAPLRVAGGVHVVGAVASGYVPTRKEVTVAGGATAGLGGTF